MFLRASNFAKTFVVILIVNILFVFAMKSFSKPVVTIDASKAGIINGERLYKINCAGCHQNGQNVINPKKPILGSSKLKSKEGFQAFLNSPPPPMPSFKNITNKPGQFDDLYNYVTSLKGK